MTKGHGSRITAMFSANAYLEILSRFPAFGNADTHEGSDTLAVDANERVFGQDPM